MIDWATERWGGRSSSLGRRWTRFERFAAERGETATAEQILAGRGARVSDVQAQLSVAPWWLRHRIDEAYAARRAVGEDVTPDQNARDQVVAFAHLWRRRRLPPQPWTEAAVGVADPIGTLRGLLRAPIPAPAPPEQDQILPLSSA
jgi:hypothetical protein